MHRPWQIWLTFAACLAVVIAAVGWLSFKALQSDAAESTARRQAAQEENVRLALWRMDSQIAPGVAQENARPYFVYNPFYSAERAYGRMFNQAKSDVDVTIPSPFLAQSGDGVLHFQIDPSHGWTSPQVPEGKFLEMAVPKYVSPSQYQTNKSQLDELSKRWSCTELNGRLPPIVINGPRPTGTYQAEIANAPIDSAQTQQSQRGQLEYQARQKSFTQSNVAAQGLNDAVPSLSNPPDQASSEVPMSTMTPMWLGHDLVLARRVVVGGQEYIQGCVLNWPVIKKRLLEEVADLLPHADLVPDSGSDPSTVRRLASLPVQLIPGPLPELISNGLSPIQASLLVAWCALILAALAAAVLLQGVLALSERRAAFVSAVTHELRTPLTTFRMYAEMLSQDMVRDESQRRSYLETLQVEADRLTHLVSNVLAYARLERGRPGGRIESVSIDKLLQVATQRLGNRATQANFNLSLETGDEAQKRLVRADPAIVEQILFNLVDNACKYAASAADRTLHLAITAHNGQTEIRLRDHGPGISPAQQRRLFQPFHKSAREAAHSAPGVGLGLALSRRLARDMGGDLRYEANSAGACFTLVLQAIS